MSRTNKTTRMVHAKLTDLEALKVIFSAKTKILDLDCTVEHPIVLVVVDQSPERREYYVHLMRRTGNGLIGHSGHLTCHTRKDDAEHAFYQERRKQLKCST